MVLGALSYHFLAIFLGGKHKLTLFLLVVVKKYIGSHKSLKKKNKEITYYHIFYIVILWLLITIFFSAHIHLHFYTIATIVYVQFCVLPQYLLLCNFNVVSLHDHHFNKLQNTLLNDYILILFTVLLLLGTSMVSSVSLSYIVLQRTLLCYVFLSLSFILFPWARVPQVGLPG